MSANPSPRSLASVPNWDEFQALKEQVRMLIDARAADKVEYERQAIAAKERVVAAEERAAAAEERAVAAEERAVAAEKRAVVAEAKLADIRGILKEFSKEFAPKEKEHTMKIREEEKAIEAKKSEQRQLRFTLWASFVVMISCGILSVVVPIWDRRVNPAPAFVSVLAAPFATAALVALGTVLASYAGLQPAKDAEARSRAFQATLVTSLEDARAQFITEVSNGVASATRS